MSFFHVDCTGIENIFQSLENVDSPQGARSYLFFIFYLFFFMGGIYGRQLTIIHQRGGE